MSFAVVHFIQENQFSEVPSNWLIEDDRCYWPPRNVKNYSSLIKNRVEPSDEWDIFEIRIETFCDTLEAARNKATNIEYTSSEEKERGRGRRKIFHINPYSSSSDEENIMKDTVSITPPPILKTSQTGKGKTNKSRQVDDAKSKVDFQTVDVSQSIIGAEVIFADIGNGNEYNTIGTAENVERDLVFQAQATAQPNRGNMITKNNPETVLNLQADLTQGMDGIEHLMRMTTKVLKVVMDIQKRLDRLEKKNDTSKWKIFKEMLPCTSLEEINAFDLLLEDDDSLCCFKEFMASLGGVNARDLVNRIMKTLITNEFGIKCSWLGQRNNIKASDFRCIQISKDIALEHMTSCDFDSHASEWLRLARLRFLREEKKNKVHAVI